MVFKLRTQSGRGSNSFRKQKYNYIVTNKKRQVHNASFLFRNHFLSIAFMIPYKEEHWVRPLSYTAVTKFKTVQKLLRIL